MDLATTIDVDAPKAPASVHGLHWAVQQACPSDWWLRLQRCGGGFFHTPAALAGMDGEPFYAELESAEGVVGIAAGLWRRCRLSQRARHVYLPTIPALIGAAGREPALETLIDRLRADGAAEVIMDSFDAGWVPRAGRNAVSFAPRMEYVVPLDDSLDAIAARFVHHHRRHQKRGEREGWRFGPVPSSQVPEVIEAVQQHAAKRAAERGTPFAVERVGGARDDLDGPWGTVAYGAWRDQELLAAALVGWGGRRAFYLQGGSTPAGYECDASTWLHWRIMCRLTDAGLAAYSLGGAPGSAMLRDDPSHGLHRFKTGFGASVTTCRGLKWTVRSTHVRTHQLWSWMRRTEQ